MSQPERLTPEQLRTLFLFEDLSDDQLAWLANRGQIVEYPAGAIIHAEGAPATSFFVLLSGMLAMSRRVQGGEIELYRSDYCGAYTGAFNAFLLDREVPEVYTATARAVSDCRLVDLSAADFGRAVREWFPMAGHLLEGVATQGREARATIERHERLIALGSVTASLTHELNNPVTAVVRATARLREQLAGMRTELGKVIRSQPSADQLEAVAELAGRALECRRGAPALSPLDTSDREDELAEWLEEHGVARSWDIAPTLVAAGLDVAWAEEFVAAVSPEYLEVGLAYPVHALESDGLLDEIDEAAERISGLLAAAKQYTQMDRSPRQSFDIHEGLDATLTMLRHKLGDEIKVVRDYESSLPHIAAYPGELNQVWTNLIDNAIDAMDGRGTLTIRTHSDGEDRLVVEIGDTGPGVPEEIRGRIFEPFFTTKQVGRGTGLGLDIAWRIVVGRHRGDIRVASDPGETWFQVLLPLTEQDPEGA